MSDRDDSAYPTTPEQNGGLYPSSGLTAVEYAAIHLRVPESGTEWLDAMIQKARRDELAGKAMQAILVWPETPDRRIDSTVQLAMKYADTMLKESDK